MHFVLGFRLVQLALRVQANALFPARQGDFCHPCFPLEATDDVNAGILVHSLFAIAARDGQHRSQQHVADPLPRELISGRRASVIRKSGKHKKSRSSVTSPEEQETLDRRPRPLM